MQMTPAAVALSGHSWWNKKPRSRRAAAHGGVEATDQVMLAGYLVMLARSGGGPSPTPPSSANPAAANNNEEQQKALTPPAVDKYNANLYECSVCGEVFRCYQALGDHKTKHRPKQPSAAVSAADGLCGASMSGRVHECSICHESFRSGQALGGHKRKHYEGEIGGGKSRRSSSDGVGISDGGGGSCSDGGGHQEPRLCGTLDLNFPPPPECPLGLSLTLKL